MKEGISEDKIKTYFSVNQLYLNKKTFIFRLN